MSSAAAIERRKPYHPRNQSHIGAIIISETADTGIDSNLLTLTFLKKAWRAALRVRKPTLLSLFRSMNAVATNMTA